MVDELFDVTDTPTMCALLKDNFPDHPIFIYPDSTGRNVTSKGVSVSDIRILQKAGFKVDAPAKNPFVKDRVNSMNARFCDTKGRRSYFINVDRCPNAASCMEQQAYDRNGDPDKSNNLDHSPDASGYFINRKWPLARLQQAYYKNAGNYK
jgi:hypothetical protein